MRFDRETAPLAWVLASSLGLGAAAAGATPPSVPPARAVVLVTIDTLRADHLGVYGQRLPLSPAIDALAAEAVVFDQAIATAPVTGPSVASMLTGHHRAVHGVERNGQRLAPEVTTLAEILRAASFRTGAVVGNQVLDHTNYDQGFERYALAAPDARRPPLFRDTPLVKSAGRLLREWRDEPFFLWVHLMAPHGPYQPPPTYLEHFPGILFRRTGDPVLRVIRGNRGLGVLPHYQHLGGPVFPAQYRRRYAAEVRYATDLVGALARRLHRLGRWDDTVFVFTADHGESLGEHDLWFQHGWFAYEDTLRVPLIVRAPGRLPAGHHVPTSVSLIDLTPTVLDLLGLPARADLEGVSIVPLATGAAVDRPAYAQNSYDNRVTALRVGRWKYIRTANPGAPPGRGATSVLLPVREELYDVETDAGETRNLDGTHAEVMGDLRARTDEWLASQLERARTRARQARTPASMPAEDRRQLDEALRALGYVE